MHTIKINGESELEQKLLTLASSHNGIKMDVIICYHASNQMWQLFHLNVLSIQAYINKEEKKFFFFF